MRSNTHYLIEIALLTPSRRKDYVYVVFKVQEILEFGHQYFGIEIFLYNHIYSALKLLF